MQASNCCKRFLENVKLAYANTVLNKFANTVLNKSESDVPPPFNGS